MASHAPELAARDEGHAGQPLGFRAQHGLAERREAVIYAARVLGVAPRDQARLDHAVERAIQRSRTHFYSICRIRLDLLHDVVAVALLTEQGEQDVEDGGRQREWRFRLAHAVIIYPLRIYSTRPTPPSRRHARTVVAQLAIGSPSQFIFLHVLCVGKPISIGCHFRGLSCEASYPSSSYCFIPPSPMRGRWKCVLASRLRNSEYAMNGRPHASIAGARRSAKTEKFIFGSNLTSPTNFRRSLRSITNIGRSRASSSLRATRRSTRKTARR